MVEPDQLDAPLISQFASTNKLREISASGETSIRNIYIQTCTTTSMNYALFFTGRIPLAGMAERIEGDVQHLIDIGRIVAHVGEGQSEPQSDSNVLFLLTNRDNVPVCGLIYEENGYSWKDYLTRFLKEKGVALISSGGHMRTLALDADSGQVYEFDPGRDPIRVPLRIDALKDADASEITLIPPKAEDCSPEMREMLQEQLDVLRGYPGGKRYATDISYLSVYPAYTQRILEKDYFPDENDLVKMGVEISDLVEQIEVGNDILNVDLPSVQVSEGDQGGQADIVVLDPETPTKEGADGIVINIPPDSETT